MALADSIQDILNADIPDSFKRFGEVLDARWINDALTASGKATVRRRKLPAELVVWLVIGMALFRDRSIGEVVGHLGLVLNNKKDKRAQVGASLAPSAIPQQRYKVGPEPLRAIFERSAGAWANTAAAECRWQGLALYGVDGTTLRVPDTDDNREGIGLPARSGRGQAGYPQVRMVALMALRSHLIAGAAFGPYSGKKSGEHSLARSLWPMLPEHSLVIMDRGFIDYGLFYRLSHGSEGAEPSSKHWLARAKKNLKWKTIEVLGEGDELVELSINSHARKKDPSLPKKMVARAIRYQINGFKPQMLLTSLLDPVLYPASEMAGLYHERWELELGYDEVKTHMLERQEALRSKKVEGIHQEIWGILLAYNLVRKEILEVATTAGVNPLRISFRHSLMLIRIFCLVEAWTCAPGNLPKRLASHHETLSSLLILPERRPKRRYKRHVKIKMTGYKRNLGKPLDKATK